MVLWHPASEAHNTVGGRIGFGADARAGSVCVKRHAASPAISGRMYAAIAAGEVSPAGTTRLGMPVSWQ
eukprot:3614558-Prymnesium_polylepis.1